MRPVVVSLPHSIRSAFKEVKQQVENTAREDRRLRRHRYYDRPTAAAFVLSASKPPALAILRSKMSARGVCKPRRNGTHIRFSSPGVFCQTFAFRSRAILPMSSPYFATSDTSQSRSNSDVWRMTLVLCDARSSSAADEGVKQRLSHRLGCVQTSHDVGLRFDLQRRSKDWDALLALLAEALQAAVLLLDCPLRIPILQRRPPRLLLLRIFVV